MKTIPASILADTPQALKIECLCRDGRRNCIWVPKSVCSYSGLDLRMEDWFIKKLASQGVQFYR